MKVRHAKILFCGASGAGKTSFCHLLKNIPLDKERNSTSLGESQQIMISQKATMKKNEWTELNPADEIYQLKLRLKHHKLTEAKDVYIQAPADALTESSEVQMASNGQVHEKPAMEISHVKKLSEKVPEVEKCLTSNFYNVEKQDVDSAEVPEIWDILTLLDTGGQPEFINMLPAVNSSATSTFVVLNMAGGSKILKERIQVHHYRNGVRSYEPYPLDYNNEDLIKCLVALLKDSIVKNVPLSVNIISKEAKSHKPSLCFVGTHLDQVTQETVDSITEGLEKLVEELEPNNNIDIFRLGTILFTVDNTIAGTDSSPDSTANKIRLEVRKMVEEKEIYEVPIAWILLELEIRRRCIKQKRSFLPISEVLEMYSNIKSEHHGAADIKSEVKAVLHFHHLFGVLLYFQDVAGMNEYVVSNPQWLFANLTNLVCCSFDKKIVNDNDIKKLKSMGILSENLIKKINTDSLGGIDIEHFFQLLHHLKIVTPYPAPDGSDYLMLSILDSFKDENSKLFDSLPPTTSIELLIQYRSGTIPRGVFCCLVVHLIQTNSEDWILQSTLCKQTLRCIFENLVVFCIHSSGHYLVLFDKVTHLEIQMRPLSIKDDSKVVYYEVQQCITEGLEQVCSCMSNDLKYGFYCNKQDCFSPILTLSSKHMDGQEPFPRHLQCKNCGLVNIKSCNLWIKSSSKGEYETIMYIYRL